MLTFKCESTMLKSMHAHCSENKPLFHVYTENVCGQ